MKKIVTIVLSLIFILSLAGCTGKKAEEPNANKDKSAVTTNDQKNAEPKKEVSSVDKIKQAGKIVMGTEATFPPFESVDTKDGKTIIGFDVDIAQAIAKKLGVKLEIKDMKFDGLIPSLADKKIDFVAAGLNKTPEREKEVDFSESYYVVPQVVVLKEGNDTIKTAADLGGKKIGIQLGSTSEAAVKAAVPNANLKLMDKNDQLMLEVKAGRIDAVVVEETAALEYVKSMGGLKIINMTELNKDKDAGAVYVAVSKGDTELLKVINDTLKELKTSGEYDKLVQKWFKN